MSMMPRKFSHSRRLSFLFRQTRNKRMRLYQHSARCPTALRAFLDCNPHYWCFIPRLTNETMLTQFNPLGEPLERESELDHLFHAGIINDPRLIDCLERVPVPPMTYSFSYEDRQQQRFFFKYLLTEGLGRLPYQSLDLYQASMIAVCKYS